ncbi:MAG: hypothetical protein IPK10_15810 [Bacteroidetes bacterium]|nr:hypothetical protein [Bacteroidota bacterium]
MMHKAVLESNLKIKHEPKAVIINKNFLRIRPSKPLVDMLITSPPYVTSYEYADLHQLSTLWLGYANDFRDLRDGTIGSLYHKQIKQSDIDSLDPLAKSTYELLKKS